MSVLVNDALVLYFVIHEPESGKCPQCIELPDADLAGVKSRKVFVIPNSPSTDKDLGAAMLWP